MKVFQHLFVFLFFFSFFFTRESNLDLYTILTKISTDNKEWNCLVGWGYRMHWLLLCGEVSPPPHKCPGYDTKQSDGEVLVILDLWGMWSVPSLPSLPGPLWPWVVVSNRVQSMEQIELNWVFILNRIDWNRTVLTFKLCKTVFK